MKITQLHHYIQDTASLFDLVADELWAQYLDSGFSYGTTNKAAEGLDILVCHPQRILLTFGAETEVYGAPKSFGDRRRSLSQTSAENPFTLLKAELAKYELDFSNCSAQQQQEIPFWGGAIGYFGYELARRLEELPEHTQDDIGLPDMAIGIYEVAIVSCHKHRKSWLLDITGENRHLKEFWLEKINSLDYSKKTLIDISDAWQAVGAQNSSYTRKSYSEKFSKIQAYLNAGDCYQINLTNRFEVPVSGSAWQSYLKMRSLSVAPFGAYMNFPFAQVLSNSPERFVECLDSVVKTSPIKGTRPRDLEVLERDLELAHELGQSGKDRAENVMIVDLLRNDLGRVCEIGSVQVPELFAVESFANVHHLVSHISGRLCDGVHAIDLLEACFPGGSITGAPKKRAMEIIDELEEYCRGIYCGAIGWIDFRGNMETNIAIRTITCADGRSYFSAGGGIIIDSEENAEYQELQDKAAIMIKTVGVDGCENFK